MYQDVYPDASDSSYTPSRAASSPSTVRTPPTPPNAIPPEFSVASIPSPPADAVPKPKPKAAKKSQRGEKFQRVDFPRVRAPPAIENDLTNLVRLMSDEGNQRIFYPDVIPGPNNNLYIPDPRLFVMAFVRLGALMRYSYRYLKENGQKLAVRNPRPNGRPKFFTFEEYIRIFLLENPHTRKDLYQWNDYLHRQIVDPRSEDFPDNNEIYFDNPYRKGNMTDADFLMELFKGTIDPETKEPTYDFFAAISTIPGEPRSWRQWMMGGQTLTNSILTPMQEYLMSMVLDMDQFITTDSSTGLNVLQSLNQGEFPAGQLRYLGPHDSETYIYWKEPIPSAEKVGTPAFETSPPTIVLAHELNRIWRDLRTDPQWSKKHAWPEYPPFLIQVNEDDTIAYDPLPKVVYRSGTEAHEQNAFGYSSPKKGGEQEYEYEEQTMGMPPEQQEEPEPEVEASSRLRTPGSTSSSRTRSKAPSPQEPVNDELLMYRYLGPGELNGYVNTCFLRSLMIATNYSRKAQFIKPLFTSFVQDYLSFGDQFFAALDRDPRLIDALNNDPTQILFGGLDKSNEMTIPQLKALWERSKRRWLTNQDMWSEDIHVLLASLWTGRRIVFINHTPQANALWFERRLEPYLETIRQRNRGAAEPPIFMYWSGGNHYEALLVDQNVDSMRKLNLLATQYLNPRRYTERMPIRIRTALGQGTNFEEPDVDETLIPSSYRASGTWNAAIDSIPDVAVRDYFKKRTQPRRSGVLDVDGDEGDDDEDKGDDENQDEQPGTGGGEPSTPSGAQISTSEIVDSPAPEWDVSMARGWRKKVNERIRAYFNRRTSNNPPYNPADKKKGRPPEAFVLYPTEYKEYLQWWKRQDNRERLRRGEEPVITPARPAATEEVFVEEAPQKQIAKITRQAIQAVEKFEGANFDRPADFTRAQEAEKMKMLINKRTTAARIAQKRSLRRTQEFFKKRNEGIEESRLAFIRQQEEYQSLFNPPSITELRQEPKPKPKPKPKPGPADLFPEGGKSPPPSPPSDTDEGGGGGQGGGPAVMGRSAGGQGGIPLEVTPPGSGGSGRSTVISRASTPPRTPMDVARTLEFETTTVQQDVQTYKEKTMEMVFQEQVVPVLERGFEALRQSIQNSPERIRRLNELSQRPSPSAKNVREQFQEIEARRELQHYEDEMSKLRNDISLLKEYIAQKRNEDSQLSETDREQLAVIRPFVETNLNLQTALSQSMNAARTSPSSLSREQLEVIREMQGTIARTAPSILPSLEPSGTLTNIVHRMMQPGRKPGILERVEADVGSVQPRVTFDLRKPEEFLSGTQPLPETEQVSSVLPYTETNITLGNQPGTAPAPFTVANLTPPTEPRVIRSLPERERTSPRPKPQDPMRTVDFDSVSKKPQAESEKTWDYSETQKRNDALLSAADTENRLAVAQLEEDRRRGAPAAAKPQAAVSQDQPPFVIDTVVKPQQQEQQQQEQQAPAPVEGQQGTMIIAGRNRRDTDIEMEDGDDDRVAQIMEQAVENQNIQEALRIQAQLEANWSTFRDAQMNPEPKNQQVFLYDPVKKPRETKSQEPEPVFVFRRESPSKSKKEENDEKLRRQIREMQERNWGDFQRMGPLGPLNQPLARIGGGGGGGGEGGGGPPADDIVMETIPPSPMSDTGDALTTNPFAISVRRRPPGGDVDMEGGTEFGKNGFDPAGDVLDPRRARHRLFSQFRDAYIGLRKPDPLWPREAGSVVPKRFRLE